MPAETDEVRYLEGFRDALETALRRLYANTAVPPELLRKLIEPVEQMRKQADFKLERVRTQIKGGSRP